ncbi:MAG: TonB-dependent receptor [Burkholderiaceae bacterium]|jgi:vitamin B12 transporter
MHDPNKIQPGVLLGARWENRTPLCTRLGQVAVLAFMLYGPRAMAQADPSASTLEPVVVSASRIEQVVGDTLPSASVITREDIENSQATDVLTLLERQAGIEVAQNGGLGAQSSIFMRGFNSNQTLVLIDGIPVNQVEDGGASLQHMMLDEVDHIEIVRGNVSALYGSQAVGGVIQIFTRGGSGPTGVQIDAQAGNDRVRNLAISANGAWGDTGTQTRAGIAVSTNGMNGFSAINAGIAPFANPNDNPYQSTSVAAHLSQQFGQSEVGLRYYGTRGRLSFDDPTDYTFIDPTYNGRIQTNEEHSDLEAATLYARLHVSQAWTTTLQFGSSLDRSANTSSFPESFDIGTTVSRTGDFSWNNVVALDPQNKVTAGVEHLDEQGNSTSYTQEFTRHVDSVFAGYLGEFGANQLQANVRGDHYSDFGSATSGLLGYGYRLTDVLKAIAQVSTAFDAPTFDDLYFPGASNPDLKPEKSRSAELGLAYEQATEGARISLYRSQVHDLIAFNSATEIPENIDEARLEGVEVSAHARWLDWQLYGNVTFQRPIDVATDQLLLRRATHNANLGVARVLGAWRFSVDVRAAGARIDSDINTFARIQLPGYSVTDLVARYRVNSEWTLSASLLNAFDRHYSLVDGYNTPGRVFLLGVSCRI